MGRIYQRTNPVDDAEAYADWAVRHTYCQACHIGQKQAEWANGGIGLSTHHLVKPGRSDEACNLLRLCLRCHDLAEGLAARYGGALLPKLTLGHCLFLKAVGDRNEHDPARLAVLYGQPLPPELLPPLWLMAERRRRRRRIR